MAKRPAINQHIHEPSCTTDHGPSQIQGPITISHGNPSFIRTLVEGRVGYVPAATMARFWGISLILDAIRNIADEVRDAADEVRDAANEVPEAADQTCDLVDEAREAADEMQEVTDELRDAIDD